MTDNSDIPISSVAQSTRKEYFDEMRLSLTRKIWEEIKGKKYGDNKANTTGNSQTF